MINFIYITTNTISGKQYVGSHRGLRGDAYLGSGVLLNNSIRKHGKEQFTRKIIIECNPEDNMILETKYIEQFKTLSPNGYNLSPTGGCSNNGGVLGDNGKEKLSKYRTGKKHSQETKDKIRVAALKRKHSQETKDKMSKSGMGKLGTKFGKPSREQIAKQKRTYNLNWYGVEELT